MQIKLKKGMAQALLNVMRSAAYLGYEEIRPVGVKVGQNSTVISISDVVVEDMTTFIANVSKTDFQYNGDSKIVHATVVANGELMLSQLLSGTGIQCERDYPILHTLAPVEVEVLFAYQAGNFLNRENEEIITQQGYTGFVAINSRHCVVNSFTFNKVDETFNEEIYEISIQTKEGVTADQVLKRSLEIVRDTSVAILQQR